MSLKYLPKSASVPYNYSLRFKMFQFIVSLFLKLSSGFQKVVTEEWIPAWLGTHLDPYTGSQDIYFIMIAVLYITIQYKYCLLQVYQHFMIAS